MTLKRAATLNASSGLDGVKGRLNRGLSDTGTINNIQNKTFTIEVNVYIDILL